MASISINALESGKAVDLERSLVEPVVKSIIPMDERAQTKQGAREDPDLHLVRLAQNGDTKAFDELVMKYSQKLYGLVYHMTSNKDDTHDLLQDVFAKAYRSVSKFRGNSMFYTWIYSIATNMTLNFLKKRKRRVASSLDDVNMTQFHSYGQVDRHPVGRVITVGYYSLINVDQYEPLANSWADNVSWLDVKSLPELAFDHNEIVNEALRSLKQRVRLQPIGFKLLPKQFTLGQMQNLYESILDVNFDKANFRKKILGMNLLKDSGKLQSDVPHRPGRLYSFNKDAYESLLQTGYTFEL